MATRDAVLEALKKIKTPSGADIVSAGMVKALTVDDGAVRFVLEVPGAQANALEPARAAAQAAAAAVDGVKTVSAVMTAHSKPTAPPDLKPGRKSEPTGPQKIPGVEKIIAIASGKGGVGKSTTSVNLALGLRALGLKVGLLDADIYGPSIPRLMGITERPEIVNERIVPIEQYGIKVMSMGFLMDEESPVIWRGPMVVSALMQLVREVEWGDLDVLVLDMPPGTGDAQLTLAQQVPLAGAVIVSTPQDLALIDARKGLKMFKQVDVPILGIIENMSTFICPHCGETSDIFGHGGAQAEAAKLGVMFLGAVPLHMDIRKYSDEGTPVVIADPDGVHAKIYKTIAMKVAALMGEAGSDED